MVAASGGSLARQERGPTGLVHQSRGLKRHAYHESAFAYHFTVPPTTALLWPGIPARTTAMLQSSR